jgi:hypothetical protein
MASFILCRRLAMRQGRIGGWSGKTRLAASPQEEIAAIGFSSSSIRTSTYARSISRKRGRSGQRPERRLSAGRRSGGERRGPRIG